MASKLKEKVAKAVDFVTPDHPERMLEDIASEKYLLHVTAGPSYDESTHKPVIVNGNTPTTFENEFVKANIKVRIRDFRGLPLAAPANSIYFDDPSRHKEQYSIGFSFVPKVDLDSLDTVWGNDFDQPIRDRLPPGFNIAVKIVKEFVDPGITLDAYADEPWLFAPSLSSFFAFRIGEKKPLDEWTDLPHPDECAPLQEGADGSGEEIRQQHNLPDDPAKRRKYFLSEKNRAPFKFEAGRLYEGDFFNPYIDFSKFSLRLPGFSISVLRYINDKTHKLRYVFKNNRTGELYFAVVMTLLFGEELEKALKEEERRRASVDVDVDVANAAESDWTGPGADVTKTAPPNGKENNRSREQAHVDDVD